MATHLSIIPAWKIPWTAASGIHKVAELNTTEHTRKHADRNQAFLQSAHGTLMKTGIGDFTGGPVVKNLPANAGDMGLITGLGRFHMLQGN